MYHIHSIEPEDDESEGEQEEKLQPLSDEEQEEKLQPLSDEEQEEKLQPLSDEEFEKLSPEEKLLRVIFGQAPPPRSRSKRTAQPQPERLTMRFGFEQQMIPADLARRVVPTLEAIVQLDRALAAALGDTGSAEIQIQRIAYGSPMDVELAQVSPPTIAILHALAQDDALSVEEQARLKDLYFQLAQAQVESAWLANQEQVLRNNKLQLEIDSIRMQQLITLFEQLFPRLSEPMRLAIIAQNFPELRLLMPPNMQAMFDAEPSSPSGTD